MAEKILTQEYLLERFDYIDNQLVWKTCYRKPYLIGKKAGWFNSSSGYFDVQLMKKNYGVHRIIFMYHYGYFPIEVDHINGNKLDNRIENLRASDSTTNKYNVGIKKDNTSGIKGVHFSKRDKKWVVSFKVNGKIKWFGQYFDINVAKFVADAMRYKYHREFAKS